MPDQSAPADSSSQAEHDSITVEQDDEVRIGVGPTTLPLSTLEWGGGILAALGFVMTPLVTGLPAGYCAWKIRPYRPAAAALTVAIIAGTAFIWTFLFFGNAIVEAVPAPETLPGEAVLFLVAFPILVVLAGVGAAYVLLVRD
jgi:hypothetical protein